MTSLASQLNSFIMSLDDFDRDNSMMKYDKAILQDCFTVVKRIENMRKRHAEKEALKN